MLADQDVILEIDGEEVIIAANYLSKKYKITHNNMRVEMVDFMHLYQNYNWAIKMLDFTTIIKNDVTIEVIF